MEVQIRVRIGVRSGREMLTVVEDIAMEKWLLEKQIELKEALSSFTGLKCVFEINRSYGRP